MEKQEKHLRIVLYLPSGSGGICHYSYQLAEALATLGIHTIVCTAANFELRHLKRTFHLYFNMKGSRLKIFWERVKIRLRGKSVCQGNTIARSGHAGGYERPHRVRRRLAFLLMLRRWGTRLKAVCFFLFERPHIIHFQWLLHPREDYYFIGLLKFLKFKIVYTAHNLLPHRNKSSHARETFTRIYERVDKIIVHADRNKIELVEEFHIDHEKITVIPHGSYDLFYANTKLSKDLARCELRFNNDNKIILFFGGIRRNKGLEYLIDAFQDVQAKINDAILLIVGKFEGKDEEGRKYSLNLVEKLHDCSGVVLVDQYIPVDRVGYYFAAADLVALPYIQVYQSGVLLLAYASGKPVVVTDAGGLSEVVEDGKSGFVVPSRDSKAFAHAMIRILQDSARKETMGRYAKHLAETAYSWENIALKTSDLYRSVLINSNRGWRTLKRGE
jgi:D-inositol-3-phosphate glycosyltransferase